MADRTLTVHFSSDVPNLDDWANRLGLPLDIDLLAKHYSAAHKALRQIKADLINHHGWTDSGIVDRLLFVIQAEAHRSSSGVPRSPSMTISLPFHVSSFFSPERRVQWQMVFHSTPFQTMRHSVPPVGKLFYLLQCLIPGMLMLAKRENKPEGVWITTRALPPPDWVDANQALLVDIFGSTHFKALLKASQNTQAAFKVTMA
jgi:hypothetical protein